MYKTCPKCGHVRTDTDRSSKAVCPACGLIFKKYLKQHFKSPYSHKNIKIKADNVGLIASTTGAESTGYHDWETVLGLLGKMDWDHRIADSVDSLGVLLMLLAFVWGGLVLYKQYQQL